MKANDYKLHNVSAASLGQSQGKRCRDFILKLGNNSSGQIKGQLDSKQFATGFN